jgi:Domain of unknown function (DUF4157)
MEGVKTATNTVTAIPAAIHLSTDSEKDNLQLKEENGLVKSSASPLIFQPKLSIGSPDDIYEKEADAMADQVMRMSMPEPISFSSAKNTVNRKCSECEQEEKLHRKESSSDSTSVAPPIVHDVINSSYGKSLDESTRSFMEPRFNYDFSNVKIHDNELAAKSASSINALAYTSGNNVVFNSGQYNTKSDSGKRLLAHELTHVVQQRGTNGAIATRIMRQTKSAGRSQSLNVDGKKYEITRSYEVITPGKEKFLPTSVKAKGDATNVYIEIKWCKDTRGNIRIGTNIPGQAVDLLQRIATTLANGGGGSEIRDEFNKTDLTPFINVEVAKSGSWSLSVQTNVTVDSSGFKGAGGSVVVDAGAIKISVAASASKEGGVSGTINLEIPLDGEPSKFKCDTEKIPAKIKPTDTCELITPEHVESKTTREPGFDEQSAYIYFKYAKKVIEEGKTKPEVDKLKGFIRNGYFIKKIIGYTSPEGLKPPAKGFEGNDILSGERAQTAFDKVIEVCTGVRQDQPEINCSGITIGTEQIPASELYTLTREGKNGIEEVEGTELIENAESQFLESPEEQRFTEDPDFKAKLARAKTPKQKAELIYPLLRRAKIILLKPITIVKTKDEVIPADRQGVECSSIPGYADIKEQWDFNDNLMRALQIK